MIEKQILGSSTGLQEVSDWPMCRGLPPSKTKEQTFKAQPSEKNKDDGGTPGQASILSRKRLGQAALNRE
jgi:hypothetical protein